MLGRVFDIRRFSIHDGPGIRTSVFLKGCTLACQWCQNPEGIEADPHLAYFRNKCISCLGCVSTCPKRAVSPREHGGGIQVDRSLCDSCGLCAEVCPSRALAMIGATVSSEDVVAEIMKDELFYGISGGGATLTGGEPLAQPDFCVDILSRLKERNIHTAIETSLQCPESALEAVRGITTLFLVDMKLADTARHVAATGAGNELIRSNFRFLASRGAQILVRVPLIPGFTVDPANLKGIGAFVHDTRSDVPIECINFNPLARDKYALLGSTWPFDPSTGKYPEEDMKAFQLLVEGRAFRSCVSGGHS